MSAYRLSTAIVVIIAASLLSACGGGIAPPPLSNVSSNAIARDAESHALLYATTETSNTVGIYTYPKAKELRDITTSSTPVGLCVSNKGSVWITYPSQANQYPHGGTKPIATVNFSGYLVVGCTADPKSGDLALPGLTKDPTYGEGAMLVYRGGSGQGQAYTCPTLFEYYFAAYDGNGNLFVDGLNASRVFSLCELPKGGSNLVPVSLQQTIGFPGDLGWDGKYLTLEDQDSGTIYRLSVRHEGAKVAGTVTLSGRSGDLITYFLLFKGAHANQILVNQSYGYGIDAWKYPAGGSPERTIPVSRVVSFVVSE